MRFTIRGHIVPYIRVTHFGKRSKRAKRYYKSQNAIAWQIKDQMRRNGWEMLPEKTPLIATLWFQVSKRLHCSDIDNMAKAVLDAAQGIVFKNDLWIDCLDVNRDLGDSDSTDFIISVCLGIED